MEFGKNNSIDSFLIFHFDVAVLVFVLLIFILGWLSDYDINNFSELLEVIDDLLPGGVGVELVNKNLIIVVVSTNVNIICANFYRFKLAEFGG